MGERLLIYFIACRKRKGEKVNLSRMWKDDTQINYNRKTTKLIEWSFRKYLVRVTHR